MTVVVIAVALLRRVKRRFEVTQVAKPTQFPKHRCSIIPRIAGLGYLSSTLSPARCWSGQGGIMIPRSLPDYILEQSALDGTHGLSSGMMEAGPEGG